jgi:O-antigen/teichoic acid export membrane protein
MRMAHGSRALTRSMSLKRNVSANFISQVWVVLMSFAFIPLYIEYLGIEAYGLIGFFTALQAWIAVLDLGLSLTLNREAARYTTLRADPTGLRQMLASAQVIYAALAVLLLWGVWAAAPYMAQRWFRASALSPEVLQTSLVLLGCAIVVRWASQIYRAAIQGLQQQVWLGGFTVFAVSIRSIGAVLLLGSGHMGVVGFFAWQLALSMVEWLVLAWYLYARLPRAEGPVRLSIAPLHRVWRFAGAVMVADLFALIMTQSDKLILSTILTMADFGYYTLAFSVGTAVAVLRTPVFQAVSPRLTADFESGDLARVALTYHKASQTMAALVLPGAALAIVHTQGLIYVWSGDSVLAERCATLAAIFVAAYTLNALVHVPAALALGAGWSGWAMWSNAVAAVLIVPALILAAREFGAIGAALANLGLNLLYFGVAVWFLHRRLLVTEWRRWFVRDSLVPTAVALLLALLSLPLAPPPGGRLASALFLVLAWAVVSLAVAWSLPYSRTLLRAAMRSGAHVAPPAREP